MGLVSKAAKKIDEKKKGFNPEYLDLNEGAVQATFNRCIASSSSVNPVRNNFISKK